MNAVTYALFAYGMTAAISLAVVGIIVLINKIMSKKDGED